MFWYPNFLALNKITNFVVSSTKNDISPLLSLIQSLHANAIPGWLIKSSKLVYMLLFWFENVISPFVET